MDYFNERSGRLYAEEIPLTTLAETHGTPLYVYSRATLERHYRAFDEAFGGKEHLICYAVKANSNLAVLNVLARLGSGFDIVSAGELERVLRAGGDPFRVVFSGVGKREDELRRALEVGIRCFNVEVPDELDILNRLAGERGVLAPISLRVNPDVDAKTHPYISTGLRENKFGIPMDAAFVEYLRAKTLPNLKIVGIDCHIGSQLTKIDPFLDAFDRLLGMVDRLAGEGIVLEHIDIGGGLGIRYNDESPPEPREYAAAVIDRLKGRNVSLFMEPGRAIVGNAGVLLTRVLYLKSNGEKHFAVVDAAMNDLIRPSLYQAWQAILPVEVPTASETQSYDIVGPVCETGDFLGKDRELAIVPGDVLAVRSAGAYGFTMSSNYNSRPRAAEILVDGDRAHVVRQRETLEGLFSLESVLPE
ncbi:MAG TPA: diaminopimelate decarboxylase [Methylococcaceae bacterium]|jgi:diaminopimelate decarboxylase|nr:diaminopimelate decarboxylase [Methylococcaceae bacterium]